MVKATAKANGKTGNKAVKAKAKKIEATPLKALKKVEAKGKKPSTEKKELGPVKSVNHLTAKQVLYIREALLSDQERLNNKEQDMSKFCLNQDELSDPLDEASINIQTSQELRFRNRENFYLKKIHGSLERLENGTYGLCESCECEINVERLMARPTAELCIACKEETEFTENHNFHQKRSKSLGRTMHELQ